MTALPILVLFLEELGLLGQPLGQLVLRYARSSYLVRYTLTRDRVIVTRIWHGKENRPR